MKMARRILKGGGASAGMAIEKELAYQNLRWGGEVMRISVRTNRGDYQAVFLTSNTNSRGGGGGGWGGGGGG